MNSGVKYRSLRHWTLLLWTWKRGAWSCQDDFCLIWSGKRPQHSPGRLVVMSFWCLPRALVLCQLLLSAHSIPYLHPSLPGCCGRLAPCVASRGCFSSACFPASLGPRVINVKTGCMVSGTKRPWWDPGCCRNAVIWAVLCLPCLL